VHSADSELLTRGEVAAKLKRSMNWLNRHIRNLQTEHGFPKALPVIGRWDGRAIDAWIQRQAGPVQTLSIELDPATLLDRRAEQLAAGVSRR
jgi:predicted DNA-binding transcriptional regulator AlpA